MVGRPRTTPLTVAIVLTLVGSLGLFVAGAYLSGDITERCLRAEPPRATAESQAAVSTSADYLRGRLNCQWSNEDGSRVSSRSLPLYSRA